MNIDILRIVTIWFVHDLIFNRYRCRYFDRLPREYIPEGVRLRRNESTSFEHESRTAELGASSNSDFSWNIAEPGVE